MGFVNLQGGVGWSLQKSQGAAGEFFVKVNDHVFKKKKNNFPIFSFLISFQGNLPYLIFYVGTCTCTSGQGYLFS